MCANKISKGIGLFRKMKSRLDVKTLLMIILFNINITRSIIYCNEIWGNTCHSYLIKINNLKKVYMRIIDGLSYCDHHAST